MSYGRAFHANNDVALINLTTAGSTAMAFALGGNSPVVRATNFSAAPALVNFGDSSVTATFPTTAAAATGYLLGPNETAVISPGKSATHVAGLCSSGTAAVFLQQGEGRP